MVTENKSDLTPKRAAFAREWIKDRNGTQAAIRAGYAESGASVEGARLLANASVRAEIDRLEASEELASRLDRDYIRSKLVHFIEHGEQESNRLRATELAGKSLRLFVDVQESSVTHDIPALQAYSEAQLALMLQQAEQPAIEDVTQED